MSWRSPRSRARFAGVALILEVGDRGEGVEHTAKAGAQLASLVAGRRRGASCSFGLEVQRLERGRVGWRRRERIAGIAATLHQLIGQPGLEALEHRRVTAERVG